MAVSGQFWRDSEDASDIRLKNHVSPVQVRPSAQKARAEISIIGPSSADAQSTAISSDFSGSGTRAL
jgi:hypothetical protein